MANRYTDCIVCLGCDEWKENIMLYKTLHGWLALFATFLNKCTQWGRQAVQST